MKNIDNKIKTGYKFICSVSDKRLYPFFKAFSEAVYKRIEAAKREEREALAKQPNYYFD